MSSAALLAVLGGTFATPAHADPVPTVTAVECPTPVPLSSITTGMTGQGLTVVSGSTPSPFNVEVLGVLKNGIGAGHDLILIKVSDVPNGHVIDQGGGIWEGMSGSPVYVNGQLLGSVSYGFTASPSPIGGLTPAADMAGLLDLSGAAARRPAQAATNARVKLSASTRKSLAAKADTATPQGSLEPIATPLGVSGLSTRRIRRLQSDLDHSKRSLTAYAAGASSSAVLGDPPTARPTGGGNFAAVISTGDIEAYGLGTTTLVCGDQALAFGHPMDLLGPVSYGASDADALAIIKDNSFGSYKMANLGANFGTLDQDRGLGVRADLTRSPAVATVTTVIDDADTGATRTGTTQVADQASLAGILPYIVFANQDAVFDEWGDGVATSSWTISGTRAGGVPFSVSRSNAWASRGDVTIDPAVDVAVAADSLLGNEAEPVTITNVTFHSTMKTKYHQRHITSMAVSVNGHKYSTAKRLSLKVGDKLKVRVGLKEFRGVGTKYAYLGLTLPKKARGQVADLAAVGGVDLAAFEDLDEGCLFDGDCEDDTTTGSLNKTIASITSAPKNNAVVAELTIDDEDTDETTTAAKATKLNTLTVTGSRDILVRVS